ncbi:MAG: S9 family peptidase, partial [Bdellovibrionales bacterium]|nr:S9 family peptidase [Massilia sp.]
KDRILVGVNNRDPKWHDIHSLDLATGKLTLVLQNEGYGGFLPDENLNLRIATKSRTDGGTDYYAVSDNKVAAMPFASVTLDDSQTTRPLGFTSDGKTMYWADSRGRDTAALIEQDIATGKTTVLAQDARADISSAIADTRTGRVQAYELDYLTHEYVAIDPSIKADLAFLKKEAKGTFWIGSRSDDGEKWIVSIDRVTEPSTTFLYERKAKRLTKLYTSRPELEGAPLVPMLAKEIKTRDGLTLVSYLTQPKAAQGANQGKGKAMAGAPVPMVLLVHGGPWGRDNYGYNTLHQWLANRGYAVLSVNFRGSTGFGKKFISAGDMQWGRKMHDDLLDAVNWAVAEGVTTRDKVAIMGGSYGGYATLAGMAFTPDQFACGVDIVGPSNLFTLLSTIPPYWESMKQQFYKRMGDPTTEAGKAILKERSPLYSADKITRPLLIGQGANDPRVNVAESDQIVAAMSAKNIPVTYVVFPDEGHGFARPANNIAFMAVTENFLGKCLGGRSEPIGAALKASSAQVKHGAQFAPGLKEAM